MGSHPGNVCEDSVLRLSYTQAELDTANINADTQQDILSFPIKLNI